MNMEHDETKIEHGKFYTATNWSVSALARLDEYFEGPQWRDNFLIWDASAGQGNLTSSYPFPKLVQTSLEQQEIGYLNQNYPHNVMIREPFDFLNDSCDRNGQCGQQIPESIMQAMTREDYVMFMNNPPYIRGSNRKGQGTRDRSGAGSTLTKSLMGDDSEFKGQDSRLHLQYIYKVTKIAEKLREEDPEKIIFACWWTPLSTWGGSSAAPFQQYHSSKWKYIQEPCFVAPAGIFSDTSNSWAIAFTCWCFDDTHQAESKILLDAYDMQKRFLSTMYVQYANINDLIRNWATFSKTSLDLKNVRKQRCVTLSSYGKVAQPTNGKRLWRVADKDGFMGVLRANGSTINQNYTANFILSEPTKTSGIVEIIYTDNLDTVIFPCVMYTLRNILRPQNKWLFDQILIMKPSKKLSPTFRTACFLLASLSDESQQWAGLVDARFDELAPNLKPGVEAVPLSEENGRTRIKNQFNFFDPNRWGHRVIKRLINAKGFAPNDKIGQLNSALYDQYHGIFLMWNGISDAGFAQVKQALKLNNKRLFEHFESTRLILQGLVFDKMFEYGFVDYTMREMLRENLIFS